MRGRSAQGPPPPPRFRPRDVVCSLDQASISTDGSRMKRILSGEEGSQTASRVLSRANALGRRLRTEASERPMRRAISAWVNPIILACTMTSR